MVDSSTLRIPYFERVAGYRHAYRAYIYGLWTVRYSRAADHPEDPRCPGCAKDGAA